MRPGLLRRHREGLNQRCCHTCQCPKHVAARPAQYGSWLPAAMFAAAPCTPSYVSVEHSDLPMPYGK